MLSRRRWGDREVHIFQSQGHPWSPGDKPFCLYTLSPDFQHCQWAPSLPAYLKREATWWKWRTRVIWAGRACLCLFHARVSGETDWGSISSPVRGESLSQEGSDIVNPVILSTAFSLSFLSSLLSEPTFQQQGEADWSNYFIPFNRLLPAPEVRLCIKLAHVSHTITSLYESVSHHLTVQLWSSSFLRWMQRGTSDLSIWSWSWLHVSAGWNSVGRTCVCEQQWQAEIRSERFHISTCILYPFTVQLR